MTDIRILSILAVAILQGCVADQPSLPEGVHISCAASEHCPDGLECVADLGECRDSGARCIERHQDGLLHQLDDGSACTDDQGQPGVCVAGLCGQGSCGDGYHDPRPTAHNGDGEQCDNGVANDDSLAGACRTNCKNAGCGDGVVDPAEQCDLGAGNSDTAPDTCRTNCELPSCGDGVQDPSLGEGCDNGTANSLQGGSSPTRRVVSIHENHGIAALQLGEARTAARLASAAAASLPG